MSGMTWEDFFRVVLIAGAASMLGVAVEVWWHNRKKASR